MEGMAKHILEGTSRILIYVRGPILGGRSDSGPHYPRTYANILQFYTVWEPPSIQNPMNPMCRMKAKWYTTGSSDPRFSAPEVRMTVVMQTNSLE